MAVNRVFGHNSTMLKRLKEAGGAFLALTLASTATVAENAPVVVELFTSQGCYSCPPADDLLGELAERDDVLPLAFHVTYWDRLGWPDTLGLEEGTARQESYARYFRTGRIYTPQMVVQGQIDVVGSQRSRVLRAVEIAAEHGDLAHIGVDIDGNQLTVQAGSDDTALVWLAAYDNENEVAIDRGENAGKTLTYYRSVRELTELGRYSGVDLTAELPLARLAADGRDGIAILVQRESDGAIVGSAQVLLPAT